MWHPPAAAFAPLKVTSKLNITKVLGYCTRTHRHKHKQIEREPITSTATRPSAYLMTNFVLSVLPAPLSPEMRMD